MVASWTARMAAAWAARMAGMALGVLPVDMEQKGEVLALLGNCQFF